jgi:hypothetical protein
VANFVQVSSAGATRLGPLTVSSNSVLPKFNA